MDPTPLRPRRDDTAADTGSLVQLGRQEPQPVPKPTIQPFQEPQYPDLPDGYAPSDPE